ncbi:MAG: DUF2312 domain-containing protein [Chloracidobacterium sp.]|nr:DUF2312 domain-containing protein [Chloracidobacterium sp.]
MTNNHEATYAKQASVIMADIAKLNEDLKDVLGSAKDAGFNPARIRKAAREMLMDTDKREKLYEAEHQLDLLRDALNLTTTTRILEAAE